MIIRPNPPGLPPQWFDPLALVEVIPGPWWTGDGHPGYPAAVVSRPPAAPPRFCELPDCGRLHDANGLCHLHERRRWEAERAGHPDVWDRSPLPHRGRPAPGAPPRLCDLAGCGNPHEGHGLCTGHNQRKRTAERKGTPDAWDRSPIPPRKPRRPKAA